MKDMNYIGKQRLEMLEMVARRFGPMIQTITTPGDEKHLVMQTTTRSWLNSSTNCAADLPPGKPLA